MYFIAERLRVIKSKLAHYIQYHAHPLPYTIVLQKSALVWSILQVCQRGGWALFCVFSHLTTKYHPSHVYSDLMDALKAK